jgi:hypothetical protein
MRPFFEDADFNFLTQIALGSVYHQAADIGEVLTTTQRIRDGDARSWVDEWTATADRIANQAAANAAAGRGQSAGAQYLRASNYYSFATYSADATGDPDRFAVLWEQHRYAWDQFIDLAELGEVVVDRIEIPYKDTTLPGYFFRCGGSDEPRRTLIFNNGSDGSIVDAWGGGIAAALSRGWNAVTFDGPGQNAALVRQNLAFRPDWEHVITPVIDHLCARGDVDEDKLALLGVSQAGYWVPRALAFEHRVAAAVVDPAVVDVATTVLGQLPPTMVGLLVAGEQAAFEHDLQVMTELWPALTPMLALRMRPYGLDSPYAFFCAVRDYQLSDELIAQITCPVLLTDPDNEQFWPGQTHQLADKLTHADTTTIAFTEAEGADGHIEPAAAAIRGERIFDWLNQQIPADREVGPNASRRELNRV